MWVIALVVSVGLLATVLLVSGGRKGDSVAAALVVVLGFAAVLAGCLMFVLPPVLVQVALGVFALPLLARRDGVRAYRLASLGAFVAGWGWAVGDGLLAGREYARLRTVYPFERVADRLPARAPGIPPAFAESDLTATESGYESLQRRADSPWHRTDQLRRLHDGQLELFVESAGFGVGRMAMANRRPDADALADEEPPEPNRFPALGQMVRDTAQDFADPAQWGYRRGELVAGFRPHAVRRRPGPARGWAVERVELVGLLLAPDPRVYVSDELPRMEAVASLPTRHPDGFESPALARLRAGEELVHENTRLLGAVRAAKQCVECHGGHRGDLLGAFSYTLRPN